MARTYGGHWHASSSSRTRATFRNVKKDTSGNKCFNDGHVKDVNREVIQQDGLMHVFRSASPAAWER